MTQCEKNACLGLMSAPIPRDDPPDNTRIFCSAMSCKIKPTDQDNTWKHQARHCVNGKDMEKGTDFEESYSPVVDPSTVRATIGIAASEALTLGTLDATDAFQNTIKDPNQRVHIAIPPF